MRLALSAAALLLVASGCGKTALRFFPEALPDGAVGEEYRGEISVLGGTTPVGGMNIDRGELPPGLALRFNRDAKDEHGIIEGKPTKAGEYRFLVTAWCYGTNVSGQKGGHEYRIVIR